MSFSGSGNRHLEHPRRSAPDLYLPSQVINVLLRPPIQEPLGHGGHRGWRDIGEIMRRDSCRFTYTNTTANTKQTYQHRG